MGTKRFTAAGVGALVFGIAAWAGATHPDAGVRARKIAADLIMAYEPCTAPDTLTDSGYDACATAVRSDPVCGFGPNGRGKLILRTRGSMLAIVMKLQGLDAGCEGTNMSILFGWRVTGDQCAGATCTLDETDYRPSYGSCQVVGGSCILRSVGPLPLLSSSARTGVELLDADIYRDGIARPFTIGLYSN